MSGSYKRSPRGWEMIVCDLDGTLIGRDHRVRESDAAALKEAREMGLAVTIATGRNAIESVGIMAAVGLEGLGIYVNGAILAEMGTGRSVDRQPMDPGVMDELVDFFGGRRHAVLVLVDEPGTGQPVYVRTDHGPAHRATLEWLVANKMQAKVEREIEAGYREHVVRVGIVVDSGESEGIERAVHETFGERVFAYAIHSAVYDCQVIEVFGSGVTKWSGIGRLCGRLGVETGRVVAIGDDVNDIAMLEGAGLSFAMGNARDAVKGRAKRVTGRQSEEGVGEAVRGILRGEW